MYLLNQFPSEAVGKKYGFMPDARWLEKVRLGSVRLAQGCSASFVSPNGLIMTNHHCASTCIAELSSKDTDYLAQGYYARIEGEEKRCPNLEANQLVEITDVSARVQTAVKGKPDKQAAEARKAEIAAIEKACATSDTLRCDVVTLYAGARFHLYKYRRYQDVRLVFAPELGIAFFGGDPDNFMFPRYNLDVTFLRAYADGKPLRTGNYFAWSEQGSKPGELTFVSGHPGGTDRQLPIAALERIRDITRPHTLLYLAEWRGMLRQFMTKGPEQARIGQDDVFSVENSLKAIRGEQGALRDAAFFSEMQAKEADLRKRIAAHPALAKELAGVWKEAAAVQAKYRELWFPHQYLENVYGFRSKMYQHALSLLRIAEESAKPNEKRLEEYAQARLPEVRQELTSEAPIYPELEIENFTFSLTKLQETLGPDDARVKAILGRKSPREVATAAVKGSRMHEAAFRKRLLEGGTAALNSTDDAMLALARVADPLAREIRERFKNEIEAPTVRLGEKIGKARFAAFGTSVYPDATFTLRLSFGQVKGWKEAGREVAPYTIVGGVYERQTGSDPFILPDTWLKNKDRIDQQTPFNFVTTNDIIGGNSGSPVLNQQGQVVGLIFDGNIHSLGGRYGFDEAMNRAVAVDSRVILEALDKIYGATRVTSEIRAR